MVQLEGVVLKVSCGKPLGLTKGYNSKGSNTTKGELN